VDSVASRFSSQHIAEQYEQIFLKVANTAHPEG
jgi:hypothetical protein